MATEFEWADDTHLRISFVVKGSVVQSTVVETFQSPISRGLTTIVFTDKNHPDRKYLATRPFADSSGGDNPIGFDSDGYIGLLEDFSYWWEDGIPDNLPVNERLPAWASSAFRLVAT